MKFRTKPIIVEAWQWLGQPKEEWPEWVAERYKAFGPRLYDNFGGGRVFIESWIVSAPEKDYEIIENDMIDYEKVEE